MSLLADVMGGHYSLEAERVYEDPAWDARAGLRGILAAGLTPFAQVCSGLASAGRPAIVTCWPKCCRDFYLNPLANAPCPPAAPPPILLLQPSGDPAALGKRVLCALTEGFQTLCTDEAKDVESHLPRNNRRVLDDLVYDLLTSLVSSGQDRQAEAVWRRGGGGQGGSGGHSRFAGVCQAARTSSQLPPGSCCSRDNSNVTAPAYTDLSPRPPHFEAGRQG